MCDLCVTCPQVCEPTGDGCIPPTAPQTCNKYHQFQMGTVLPPGGVVVVFGGYNELRGGSSVISMTLEESAQFGWSEVQFSSLQNGEQYSGKVSVSSSCCSVHGATCCEDDLPTSGADTLSDLLAVLKFLRFVVGARSAFGLTVIEAIILIYKIIKNKIKNL